MNKFEPEKVQVILIGGLLKKRLYDVRNELATIANFEIRSLIFTHLSEYLDKYKSNVLACVKTGFNLKSITKLQELIDSCREFVKINFKSEDIVAIEFDDSGLDVMYRVSGSAKEFVMGFDPVTGVLVEAKTVEQLKKAAEYLNDLIAFVEDVLIPGYKDSWNAIEKSIDRVIEDLPERLKKARAKMVLSGGKHEE